MIAHVSFQIKVTKLNNYELKYQQRIGAVREQEVKLLRRELFFWAMTLVITVTSPVIASAATFATYVLVSEDNILTAATTFTVLLLFAALRFPINYAGRLIGRAAQASDSMRRIANFLDRDTRCVREDDCSKPLQSDGKEQVASETEASGILNVQGATFRVGRRVASAPQEHSEANNASAGSQAAFSIKDVNFSLSAGQILAIVGPVGSGKSTLINGIIGESQASHDTLVSKRGSVAYAGQIPFILNATLRANILFGLPFEKERYEAVLEACCLKQDIEQLGGARDLTEIGERGVTLSGGKCVR
jgi:ABC-type multidrug transport system fused ATPase/permease subunit